MKSIHIPPKNFPKHTTLSIYWFPWRFAIGFEIEIPDKSIALDLLLIRVVLWL